MRRVFALLALSACIAFAQTAITNARMDGTVTDPQGAVVVGAEVTVVSANGASFKATTDEHGQWALPSMPQATYRVSVTMKGFRTTVVDRVVMEPGIPVTANAKLEIGSMTETVEVSGTQELVQTSSATVNNSLEKRQMTELPMLSRNGLDMLMSLPGIQSGSANRNSTIIAQKVWHVYVPRRGTNGASPTRIPPLTGFQRSDQHYRGWSEHPGQH